MHDGNFDASVVTHIVCTSECEGSTVRCFEEEEASFLLFRLSVLSKRISFQSNTF